MKSIVINFNFIIVAAVILTTLTLTNHAIGANQGTGEPLSLNLNLENCEGINSFNFGSVNNSTMDQITEKYVLKENITLKAEWTMIKYNVHACQDTKFNFLVMNSFREFYAAT